MARKKKPITVEGVEYPVIERMGYQHSAGCYAVLVQMPDGTERVARSCSARSPWIFHTAADRVAPLLEAIARGRGRRVTG